MSKLLCVNPNLRKNTLLQYQAYAYRNSVRKTCVLGVIGYTRTELCENFF